MTEAERIEKLETTIDGLRARNAQLFANMSIIGAKVQALESIHRMELEQWMQEQWAKEQAAKPKRPE
jgi:aerobic-type carbon monoxide dehydrogenase small subunit (CoxS/CutS family)